MINLIPPEAEKVVRREYILRVGGTLAFLFGALFVILTIALIPTYVLIGAQIDTSVRQAEEATLDEEFARADAEVTLTKAFLDRIRAGEASLPASDAIERLKEAAPAGVSLGLFIVNSGQKTLAIEKIQVQGIAATRESLAAFRAAVESTDMFEKAEVPIADLARDSNLPFTMTVTLKK